MICPECGTRIPKEKNECHFCHYEIIQNAEESNQQNSPSKTIQNSTQNLEDPDWYISSYQSAQLSMMAIMLSAIAIIITGSSSLVESLSTKVSITNGNITETPPIFFKFGPVQFPLIIVATVFILVLIFIMLIAFLYYTNRAKIAHDEMKNKKS